MRVHYLQHVEYENLANIEPWLKTRGHKLTRTRLYAGDRPPSTDKFDWLIIMGGPMNIYEEKQYPWLKAEKKFIKSAIKSGKAVLGICLGGQLLSDCLGGKVTRNKYKEIGFFPVELTAAGKKSVIFSGMDKKFTAMHWHGDTFSTPPGAKNLAKSRGCKNQAFEYKGRVFGLQFHFEYAPHHIIEYFKDPANVLKPDKFVQDAETILKDSCGYRQIKTVMEQVLQNAEKAALKQSQ